MHAARYVTAIVLAHLLVNIVHGAAHQQLHIGLSLVETLFVGVVILACPLLAMVLLWTSQQRLGLILLALSMAGSLVFGLCHHFLMTGPDHVGEQAAGPWATTFAVTSYLLLLTEAIGTDAGIRFLYRKGAA
ncbi:MAG: hypothetical protein ABSH32_03790 [Bryobacteraceae bacterium]|jgi:hypothetical protein